MSKRDREEWDSILETDRVFGIETDPDGQPWLLLFKPQDDSFPGMRERVKLTSEKLLALRDHIADALSLVKPYRSIDDRQPTGDDDR